MKRPHGPGKGQRGAVRRDRGMRMGKWTRLRAGGRDEVVAVWGGAGDFG